MNGIVALLTLASIAQGPHAGETPAQKDSRMKWWREARFGMFIHWGLYAQPAGTWKGKRTDGIGEWIMQNLKIPVDDYATLVPTFNPSQFDAEKWVSVAKAAGMKYVVITAKHHEGFAMYRSADPFSISATPFKRDPIAEIAAACKKAGLKFGVYYSQAQDWSHPGGGAYGGHWDPKQNGDLHAYVRNVAAPQLRELMRYKPAVLWWDTPVEMSKEDVDALLAPLPKSIIMNNRLGNGISGDTETPEQTIPPTGFPGRDWETCMTINDTWGYKSFDTNFKPTQTLLRNLIDIASKGGNYLLNVGPDAKGVIPQPEIDRLLEVGEWLKRNGRSIYGTTASPYRRLPFNGRVTLKGNSLFVNVFDWPASGLVLPGLTTPVDEVRLVSSGEKLSFSQKDGTVSIVPVRTEPGAISTAIELKLSGKPVIVLPDTTIEIGAAGKSLLADEADLAGGLQVEHEPANIGYWTNKNGSVSWKINARERYAGQASIEYACGEGAEGSRVALLLDDKPVTEWTVESTGGWGTYRSISLPGQVDISSGKHTLKIVVRSMPRGAVMNLRRLSLNRIGR